MYDTVITLRHYTLRHYAAHNSTSNSGFRSVRLRPKGKALMTKAKPSPHGALSGARFLLGIVGINSTRAGISLVRHSRDRSPCIGAAHSNAHPNRGISIHVFPSNTAHNRGLLVDSRKGTCRCSNLLNSRSFLLAAGSVQLRAKVRSAEWL